MNGTLVGWLAFVFAGTAGAAPADGKRPNIIVVLADDLGYGDLGCYGGKIPTPHVDKLAKQGLRCLDAHSGSSVCSPTRYGLLTGRYAWRTSWMKSGVLAGFDPPLMESGRLTVAELLRRHGYTTACIGKWHLGFSWQWPTAKGRPSLDVPFTQRNAWDKLNYPSVSAAITGGPRSHGFGYFFGQTAPNQDPFCFVENERVIGLAPDAAGQEFSRTRRPVALKDEDILPTLVAKAVGYIAERSREKKPFFLYFPLTSPHSPVAPSAKYKGKSGLGNIADFIQETDGALGEITAALDKHGLAESTLILFTSDNGHIPTEPDLRKAGHSANGPLRGSKGGIYEGGHRIPLVLRWPGVIAPNRTSEEPLCHTHLLATCAELLGVTLPEGAAEDSFSILPMLRDEKLAGPTHPMIVHQSLAGELAIRKGPWKWIEGKELFHLGNDLAETQDLAATNPEKVAELRDLLSKLRKENRSR